VDNGRVLASALLKLVKNVTEPTVIRYTLARMEELLPDGLRLRKRVAYFVEDGKALDAAPFLRMVRNDTGYVQYAASHLLALFLTYVMDLVRSPPQAQRTHRDGMNGCSVRPRFEDVDALAQWAVQALKLGPNSTDPNRANITRAAVNAMMVLLRHQKSRIVFVKQGGVAPYVIGFHHGFVSTLSD
jgi:V-type H+-transporting ATPase subunit H